MLNVANELKVAEGKNSNTTLVNVKLIMEIIRKVLMYHSNTTLVNVKLIQLNY